MMRAVLCQSSGDPSDLGVTEVAPPEMMAGGVRIAVEAAACNFADSLIVAGKYQEKPDPPFIPGFEVAGRVLETAPDVATVKPGERVMAVLDWGGFAEQVVARKDDVVPLPADLDMVTAAGFPIAYGTSHFGLKHRAALRPGEVLVVHGAAGGVGLTAVEIGRALGATVIATAGGADKLAIAAAHGAHHGIDSRTEDVRLGIKALTGGRGADVVYDPVGGPLFEASLRSTAPNGRILLVGFASGSVPQIPANHLLVKNITVIGYAWGAYRRLAPALVRESLAECLAWHAAGRLRPHVSQVLPLERAAEAIGLLLNRKATGKVVLAP